MYLINYLEVIKNPLTHFATREEVRQFHRAIQQLAIKDDDINPDDFIIICSVCCEKCSEFSTHFPTGC